MRAVCLCNNVSILCDLKNYLWSNSEAALNIEFYLCDFVSVIEIAC